MVYGLFIFTRYILTLRRYYGDISLQASHLSEKQSVSENLQEYTTISKVDLKKKM